ncbi:MAG: hypothetical protein QM610_10065 [Chitinophagaceae bacterium]
MTNHELKKAAQESINAGKSKQETFDTLKPTSGIPDKTLAGIIRVMVTPAAKEKYKPLNRILVLLLVVWAIISIVDIVMVMNMGFSISLLSIVPSLMTVLVIVGITRYWSGFHYLVGFVSLMGLLRNINTLLTLMEQGVSYPLIYASILVGVLIVILAFSLGTKLAPKFSTVMTSVTDTNGQEQKIPTIKFVD